LDTLQCRIPADDDATTDREITWRRFAARSWREQWVKAPARRRHSFPRRANRANAGRDFGPVFFMIAAR